MLRPILLFLMIFNHWIVHRTQSKCGDLLWLNIIVVEIGKRNNWKCFSINICILWAVSKSTWLKMEREHHLNRMLSILHSSFWLMFIGLFGHLVNWHSVGRKKKGNKHCDVWKFQYLGNKVDKICHKIDIRFTFYHPSSFRTCPLYFDWLIHFCIWNIARCHFLSVTFPIESYIWHFQFIGMKSKTHRSQYPIGSRFSNRNGVERKKCQITNRNKFDWRVE